MDKQMRAVETWMTTKTLKWTKWLQKHFKHPYNTIYKWIFLPQIFLTKTFVEHLTVCMGKQSLEGARAGKNLHSSN